jgi:hypothetical protein
MRFTLFWKNQFDENTKPEKKQMCVSNSTSELNWHGILSLQLQVIDSKYHRIDLSLPCNPHLFRLQDNLHLVDLWWLKPIDDELGTIREHMELNTGCALISGECLHPGVPYTFDVEIEGMEARWVRLSGFSNKVLQQIQRSDWMNVLLKQNLMLRSDMLYFASTFDVGVYWLFECVGFPMAFFSISLSSPP